MLGMLVMSRKNYTLEEVNKGNQDPRVVMLVTVEAEYRGRAGGVVTVV